jgi:hypothetical protein
MICKLKVHLIDSDILNYLIRGIIIIANRVEIIIRKTALTTPMKQWRKKRKKRKTEKDLKLSTAKIFELRLRNTKLAATLSITIFKAIALRTGINLRII